MIGKRESKEWKAILDCKCYLCSLIIQFVRKMIIRMSYE
jgi:hypothetical protein